MGGMHGAMVSSVKNGMLDAYLDNVRTARRSLWETGMHWPGLEIIIKQGNMTVMVRGGGIECSISKKVW